MISLPRDAFQFLARTTAKTSILLLAKKPDAAVSQREPIFYAKADVIGYTPSGVTDRNDLIAINDCFDQWRTLVQKAYKGATLRATALAAAKTRATQGNARVFLYDLDLTNPSERLDFSYRRMRDIVSQISNPMKLGDILENVTRIPEEKDIHEYAYVSSMDGRVRSKGEQDLAYTERELREIREGDVLLSGIDVVNGAVGVVGRDCDGLVVSKEFFTLRPRGDAPSLVPEYIACLLRSPRMREIIEGTVTGVSNRTRIEDIAMLLELPIPAPASPTEQQRIADRLNAAYRSQDEARNTLAEIEASLSAA